MVWHTVHWSKTLKIVLPFLFIQLRMDSESNQHPGIMIILYIVYIYSILSQAYKCINILFVTTFTLYLLFQFGIQFKSLWTILFVKS